MRKAYVFFGIFGIFFLLASAYVISRFLSTSVGGSPCFLIRTEKIMEMKDVGFFPQNITITRCTKLTFHNSGTVDHWPASNIHPTHGIYPEFDPKRGIKPQESWSFVFDRVGRWKYHDHLYPLVHGLITVLPN